MRFSCITSRSVCGPSNINVKRNKECFLFRHIKLNSRFIVVTTSDVTLSRPKISLILSVETLPIRLEVLHWDLHSLRVVPALRVGSRNSWSSPYNFAAPSAIGTMWYQDFFRIDSARINFWSFHLFQFLFFLLLNSMHNTLHHDGWIHASLRGKEFHVNSNWTCLFWTWPARCHWWDANSLETSC